MIDLKPGLRLPLVDHLMQQRVLNLAPRVPRDVAAADGNTEWTSGSDLHRELTEAGAHAARYPDRNLPQRPTEVLEVELPVQAHQSEKHRNITRPRAFSAFGSGARWRMLLNWKREELTLGPEAQRPRHPGVQELDDGLQHSIRRKSIAPVNPENPLIEAEHHRSVGVGLNLFDVTKAKGLKPNRETILKSGGLPRCPADPLTFYAAVPLPRLHSP